MDMVNNHPSMSSAELALTYTHHHHSNAIDEILDREWGMGDWGNNRDIFSACLNCAHTHNGTNQSTPPTPHHQSYHHAELAVCYRNRQHMLLSRQAQHVAGITVIHSSVFSSEFRCNGSRNTAQQQCVRACKITYMAQQHNRPAGMAK